MGSLNKPTKQMTDKMETLTKKEAMYQRIEEHGNKLNKVFDTGIEPVKLCKKLHSLENKANRLATQYCNGDIQCDQWEEESLKISYKLADILGLEEDIFPVFINGDPRGYALKIRDDYMRENNIDLPRDFGGYGLIAPDLTN